MATTGATWRSTALARLADEIFDVLVVGGGATGAAIARDAALRGLRVALCDHSDFAGQTSSQSSKLIHGGLRYLQYGDLPLVFEALAERHRLLATAPHLCRPTEFLFPVYAGEKPSLTTLALGVTVYDALALWRSPARSRRVAPREIYQLAPLLRTAGLKGAELYVDCQTDDARLVLENVLDAESAGAVAASYLHVRSSGRAQGYLRTIEVQDRDTGQIFAIRAHAVVNATGPFSDAFRQGPRVLRPTLGVHIVVDSEVLPTGGRAIVIRSPRDNRLIFTLPAGARTLVGTTDTDWRPDDGDRTPRPEDEIRARGADVDYLLEAVNHAYPPARIGREQVISTFAGLRPLIASNASSPSATSREHDIAVDHSGVLTVAGGKLTTTRAMAEEAVDKLIEVLRARGQDRTFGRCLTRTRPLPGGSHVPSLESYELAADVKTRLAQAYGGRAGRIAALAAAHPGLETRLVPDLPYLRAEIVFAVRHDRVLEVEDVLRRRVPLFRDSADRGVAAAQEVARMLGDELGWSAARRTRSVLAYGDAVDVSERWRSEPARSEQARSEPTRARSTSAA